ncbi:hypothetical protein KW800_02305 [Candidatus Parcubacteria bacterium]|nr:hypothetical protein [Candidatus Parcubacteria bacterium]
MNFEIPKSSESRESVEDINIVREEIRGALLAGVCAFDEDGECEKVWFEKHNDDFESFFNDFIANNKDVLNLWNSDRDMICNMFHEKLNDLDIKKDLAA